MSICLIVCLSMGNSGPATNNDSCLVANIYQTYHIPVMPNVKFYITHVKLIIIFIYYNTFGSFNKIANMSINEILRLLTTSVASLILISYWLKLYGQHSDWLSGRYSAQP